MTFQTFGRLATAPTMAPVSQPAWAFDRTPHGVRIMPATGRNHGLDPAACLRGTGLTPSAVEDPDTQVAAEQELTVTRNLLAALGDEPGLRVETGLRYTLGTAGTTLFGGQLPAIDFRPSYAGTASHPAATAGRTNGPRSGGTGCGVFSTDAAIVST